ncbi:MAG: ATP-binding protein [bacterium]
MVLEELKKKVQSRSFWREGSEKSLLPDRNLPRPKYLAKLNHLQSVNVVTSIMGQRRCGKSVIGRQFIKEMWDRGVPRKNILYVNFFLKPIVDIRLEKNFVDIVDWWMEECVDKNHPSLLFLDEVQELENWDENIASIFEDDSLPCRLIITGSNSKMLSEDFTTRLGGRYTALNVFPFSFAEFCRFTKAEYNSRSIEKYLLSGGMPEVLKVHDEEQRSQLISDIINSTVKNDIVLRYNPSNPELLYTLIDFCRMSFSQELSVKSISKSVFQNLKIKRRDRNGFQSTSSLVSTYISYMQDVYFLYSPPTYSHRTKEILKRGTDKIYLGDLCLADFKVQTQKGRLLENMVYIDLLRNNFKVERYLGYRNKNLEIDFYVEKGDKSALVQVCWLLGDSVENSALWEREFGNLHYTKLDVPKFVVSLDDNIQSPFKEISHMNIMDFISWVEG